MGLQRLGHDSSDLAATVVALNRKKWVTSARLKGFKTIEGFQIWGASTQTSHLKCQGAILSPSEHGLTQS